MNSVEIGAWLGERAGQSLRSIWNRIGLVMFLFFWWRGGFWWAVIITALYCGFLRWRASRQTAVPYRDTSKGSARWAEAGDLGGSNHLALTLDPTRYLLGLHDPIPVPQNCSATFAFNAKGSGSKMLCEPLVVTGSKAIDGSSGERVDDGHVTTIAGAGGGKGIACVIPNVSLYSGSVLVFDPKAEILKATCAARLRMGQQVWVVDPFDAAPPELRAKHLARFNPLDLLAEHLAAGRHDKVFDEARSIADLIVVSKKTETQEHFNDRARAFISAAILFACYAEDYQDRQSHPLNLLTVKDCILNYFTSAAKLQLFADICSETPHLRGAGGSIAMASGEERAGVLASVMRHTEFLDSPAVNETLRHSDFRFADMKRHSITVYLMLPASALATYSRLARLWIGSALLAFMADTAPGPRRTLLMLDEVAQLGNLEPLVRALPLVRGYGVDIWTLWQDMRQMKSAYGEHDCNAFLANASYQQFFAVRDLETAKYVSETLGKETIYDTTYTKSDGQTRGSNYGSNHGGEQTTYNSGHSDGRTTTEGISVSTIGRELLTADEVIGLPDSHLLVLMPGKLPVRARKYDTREAHYRAALLEVPVSAPLPSPAPHLQPDAAFNHSQTTQPFSDEDKVSAGFSTI